MVPGAETSVESPALCRRVSVRAQDAAEKRWLRDFYFFFHVSLVLL